MKKTILISMLLSLSAQAAVLKQDVIIDSQDIHLKDIFEQLNKDGDKKVLKAPGAGENVVLDTQYLYSLAKQNQIDWLPLNRGQSIKISRASETVSIDEINGYVHKELAKQIADERFKTIIHHPVEIHFPKDKMGEVKLTDLKFNINKTQFWATLNKIEQGGVTTQYKINGEILPINLIPVVVREIQKGETIKPEDIELIEMEAKKLNGSVIMDENLLIGSTARYNAIRPHTAIKQSEVAILNIVNKGEAVLIRVTTPAMNITAKGKALESGGMRHSIKVLNTSSNKIINATVTAPGQVNIAVQNVGAL